MKQLTDKQKRERKFSLALPILTLPFLCLAFWAMGGGKGNLEGIEDQQGLNMTLPEAQIESYSMNKLESYEQAEKKASQIREQMRMDPFANSSTEQVDTSRRFSLGSEQKSKLQETENAVQEKLSDLQKLITQPEITNKPVQEEHLARERLQKPVPIDPDMRRLEAMMASVIEPEMEDPEMERIDSMLDKLLDVQHPQRVHERMSQTNALQREGVFSVSLDREAPQAEHYNESGYPKKERNGFYSLENERKQSFASIQPAITARVTKDQEVVTGASIEMELTQSVFIEGVEFPNGTRVTGRCSLNGERLNIEVQRIRSGNLIVPVNLKAMDLDALPGIRIPNAITGDAVKQGADDGVQSMNMMSMSSSWEAQASMAGMETVKGILSKKAKLVKVTVKAGHPLLLADQSSN
jgi:conjugative transposon TraM protein